MSLTVLIAGGGIGGLVTALCCARQGYAVRVFEQAPRFAQVGAGIQLSPNATRVLHYLGLEAALRECAFLPEGTQFRHWRSGKVIAESALGDAVQQRYGQPYYHIHRGDLLQVLLNAARQSSDIQLHTGSPVAGFEQGDSAVQVLVNGQSYDGDLLVGADGIHSAVRAALWGPEQPHFTGNIAWRALVPVERLPENLIAPVSSVWWGPGKHFVHYYVRSGSLVNCVCVVEKPGWEIESWITPGEHAELRAEFAGWHSDILQLIDCADRDALYKWALYDRQPMQRWGKGRVTLLGDACHATLPFMAQGAAMAIEDAVVLAGNLVNADSNADLPSALQHYEAARQTRTAAIQAGSRRNATVFHLSGLKAWARNRAARVAGGRTMHALFSYDALQEAQVTDKAT